MKYVLLLLSLFSCAAQAADITLVWDASPAEDNIAKYALYAEKAGKTERTEVATNTHTIKGVTPDAYAFYVTAINSAGVESLPSNKVLLPAAPKGLNITIKINVEVTQ